MVAPDRDDILVFDGGMVHVPSPVALLFNRGLRAGHTCAAMTVTITVSPQGRSEDYTVGKENSLERVNKIAQLTRNDWFNLSGFRSMERGAMREPIDGACGKAAGLTAGGPRSTQEAKWAKPVF